MVKLRAEIIRARDFTTIVIALEVIGWDIDPFGSALIQIKKAGGRCFLREPGWIDTIGLDIATLPWQVFVPALRKVLDLLRRKVSCDNGSLIYRTDSNGCWRAFRIGFDDPGILKHWILNRLRREELQKPGRIKSSYHRARDENMAHGLDLPRPQGWKMCLFAGHEALWATATTKWLRRATLASGCPAWFACPGSHVTPQVERRVLVGRLCPRELIWCGVVRTQHLTGPWLNRFKIECENAFLLCLWMSSLYLLWWLASASFKTFLRRSFVLTTVGIRICFLPQMVLAKWMWLLWLCFSFC